MVKQTRKPCYEEVIVDGKVKFECCKCGRLCRSALLVAVHVYQNHPALRVNTITEEYRRPILRLYLNGLLTP